MRFCVLLSLIALLLAFALPLNAQNAQIGNVMMANSLLFRISCPGGGYSAQERVDAVQQRVNDLIIPGGINLDGVQIRTSGNTTAIYAGDNLLITVGECDARANNTTVSKLAKLWVARFKEIYPTVIPPIHGQSPPSE